MRSPLCAPLLVLLAVASPARALDAPEVQVAPTVERRRALRTLNVRRTPDSGAPLRGRIEEGGVFAVSARAQGPGCAGDWGQVGVEGWTCLSRTEATEVAPVSLPVLVPYPTPGPDERETYARTGEYDREEGGSPLLPFIYGERGRRGAPPIYASAEAYERGAAPVDWARQDRALVFQGAVTTARGEVLVRIDGTVIPADEVLLYPIDRFQGLDLRLDPLPEGRIPAWASATRGVPIYRAPSRTAEVGATLAYHASLILDAVPYDPDGAWWVAPDALGPGVAGYLPEQLGLRRVTVQPPPEDAGASLWLDVDVAEQVLTAWQDGRLVYATLISTGKPSDETPTGLYRVGDKAVAVDMTSLPGAAEPYEVERVPWVAHFAPRYALHGAFWHGSFGRTRSHGCINLSPRDARWVFDHIRPELALGWSMVVESPGDPGTLLRVRDGADPVTDRRRPLVYGRSESPKAPVSEAPAP